MPKNGCNGRFMQGCGKVPASAHSAYIGVYVFVTASPEPKGSLMKPYYSRSSSTAHGSIAISRYPSYSFLANSSAIQLFPTRRAPSIMTAERPLLTDFQSSSFEYILRFMLGIISYYCPQSKSICQNSRYSQSSILPKYTIITKANITKIQGF